MSTRDRESERAPGRPSSTEVVPGSRAVDVVGRRARRAHAARKAAEGRGLGVARRRAALVALVVLAALVAPGAAQACPVCFGDSDAPMAHGLNNGVLFLLGVVATVQGGFAALFLSIRYRTKKLRERKQSFRIIDGGRG